eukprot:scaffold51_cov70-Cylindrotheca_fusiformis.AAC.2
MGPLSSWCWCEAFLDTTPIYFAVVALNGGWKGASRWPKEQKFVVTRLPKKGRKARAQNLGKKRPTRFPLVDRKALEDEMVRAQDEMERVHDE